MEKHPHIYIIAGPNGAGKTTFAEEFLPRYVKCQTFINADLIARGLSGFSPDAVAFKAGRLLLEQIDVFAAKRINFSFETTLSGLAYLFRLKNLKRQGFLIHLFFLWIPDVTLSLARVASRVKMGGHTIPEKVIRRRFHKGVRNLFKFYRPVLDSWMLLDNSGNIPRVIAGEEAGELSVSDQSLYGKILKIAEEK